RRFLPHVLPGAERVRKPGIAGEPAAAGGGARRGARRPGTVAPPCRSHGHHGGQHGTCLAPSALSSERIHRHLTRGTAPDAASLEVIRSCAETIGNAVETVRTLVDEFSVLARFPASRPQPASLNNLVESALVMFNGRLEGIRVRTELAHDLPSVMADPEAIKRAVANLVDNAAEAMQDAILKEITISTSLVASRDAVELVVSDTGQGWGWPLSQELGKPTVVRSAWKKTSRSAAASLSSCR